MKLIVYLYGKGDKRITDVKAIAIAETMEDELFLAFLKMHPEIKTNFQFERKEVNNGS